MIVESRVDLPKPSSHQHMVAQDIYGVLNLPASPETHRVCVDSASRHSLKLSRSKIQRHVPSSRLPTLRRCNASMSTALLRFLQFSLNFSRWFSVTDQYDSTQRLAALTHLRKSYSACFCGPPRSGSVAGRIPSSCTQSIRQALQRSRQILPGDP